MRGGECWLLCPAALPREAEGGSSREETRQRREQRVWNLAANPCAFHCTAHRPLSSPFPPGGAPRPRRAARSLRACTAVVPWLRGIPAVALVPLTSVSPASSTAAGTAGGGLGPFSWDGRGTGGSLLAPAAGAALPRIAFAADAGPRSLRGCPRTSARASPAACGSPLGRSEGCCSACEQISEWL